MEGQEPVYYSVDRSLHPNAFPVAERRYVTVHKIDVLYFNVDSRSEFRWMRTGTNESIHTVVAQVAKHVSRGLYRLESLNASETSCVVVISTTKSDTELWDGGFHGINKTQSLNDVPEEARKCPATLSATEDKRYMPKAHGRSNTTMPRLGHPITSYCKWHETPRGKRDGYLRMDAP
ncbi:hypothetical protein PG990_012221 [Apiospora arundinis]